MGAGDSVVPILLPFSAPVAQVAPATTQEARYATILSRIAVMKRHYPRLFHESVLGKTSEGRTIPLLRLSVDDDSGNEPAPDKPAVLLVGGVHPREQQPMLCLMWLADELLSRYGKDAVVTKLLRERDIYLVPVLNVDGKLYDETAVPGRDWRKNRHKNADGSVGIDLNRNFPVRFDGDPETSPLWCDTTTRPGSNIYEGAAPLSEPESAALAGFLTQHAGELRLFVDVHSPLREIVTPNFVSEADAPRYAELTQGIRTRQHDLPYRATPLSLSEPKPGIRGGDTGLTYTFAYYTLGIIGLNLEIGLKSPVPTDLMERHYPSVARVRTEYEANIREPLLYLLNAAGDLPAAGRGTVALSANILDKPLTPGATVSWTPSVVGAAEFAVLTSETANVAVESELRRVPVKTGFTLHVSPDAKPGQVASLTLTVWDRKRNLSHCRVILNIAPKEGLK